MPFINQYSPIGELLNSFAQVSNPPGQYERQDELKQQFAAGGQLIRQDQLVRDPNTGTVTLHAAARHYYGADDKLMAVQRYSYRSTAVRDGTWEEYWYDALGRRVLTRARRDSSGTYPGTTSGLLCTGTNICRSYKERVSWDGDQALVEDRTPEITPTDASNSGVVRNVHGLTLDEPLSVIADAIRIPNYNWRGQAMSNVFVDGSAGDITLGYTATEVDWPAATQAETYFGQSPDANPSTNPKRWLGTFVANGQGTTGMLYRRNRYFDPKSGQFTQADPTGIGTGTNVFGFANGDPINFSDPYGLCPLTASECPRGYFTALGGTIGATAGGAVAIGCAATTEGICVVAAPNIVAGFAALGTSFGVAADKYNGTVLPALSWDGVKRFAGALGWVIGAWASEGKTQVQRIEQERTRQKQEQTIKDQRREKKKGEGSGGDNDPDAKPPSPE